MLCLPDQLVLLPFLSMKVRHGGGIANHKKEGLMGNLWPRMRQGRVVVSAAVLSGILAVVARCGGGDSGGGTLAPAP